MEKMSDCTPQQAQLSWRAWLRIISVPCVCGLAYVLFVVFDAGAVLQETWMDSHVRHQGASGVLLYIALVAALTAVGVPRQLLSFLGGYVFDVLWGTLWATVGTGLACVLTFSYARFLGQQALQKRWGHRFKTFNAVVGQSPFVLTAVVRIMPLGSNFITNIAAGVSTIPAWPFLAGSVTGFTVQNAIFALMGSGLRLSSHAHAALSGVLYVLSLSLGYWVYRRYKQVSG